MNRKRPFYVNIDLPRGLDFKKQIQLNPKKALLIFEPKRRRKK